MKQIRRFQKGAAPDTRTFLVCLNIVLAFGCTSTPDPKPISPEVDSAFLTSNGLQGKEEVLFAGIWQTPLFGGTFVATDERFYLFNDKGGINLLKWRRWGDRIEPTPEYLVAVLDYRNIMTLTKSKRDRPEKVINLRHKLHGEIQLFTLRGDDRGTTDIDDAIEIITLQVRKHGGSL